MLSDKQIIKDELNTRFHHFLHSDKKKFISQSLSILPNRLLSQSTSFYSKKKYCFIKSYIDFIYRENEPETIVWHTSPEKVEKAIRFGILRFDSLSSKLICALGKYHKSLLNRIYNQGIISDKHELKIALLNLGQDNIKALAPLERLINTYDHNLTAYANQHRVTSELSNYIKKINSNYQKISTLKKEFIAYDRNIDKKWQNHFKHINTLCEQIKQTNVEELFDINHYNSLYVFIKQQAIYHIRNIQEINQNISFAIKSLSLRRGDLNSACEDALKEINDHELDFHNPITCEHQGIFNTRDKLIAINFKKIAHNPKEINQTLMAISQIEHKDLIEKVSDNKFQLNKLHDKKLDLLTTPLTQWKTKKKSAVFKKILFMFWNILSGLIIGLTIDLVIAMTYGIAGIKIKTFASSARLEIQNELLDHTTYQYLSTHFIYNQYSPVNTAFFKLHHLIKSIYLDFSYSSPSPLEKSDESFWPELYADFNESKEKIDDQVLSSVYEKLIKLEKNYYEARVKHTEKSTSMLATFEYDKLTSMSADAPYPLNNGEWTDLANTMISGTVIGMDIFAHEIYSKNPLLGFVFCSSYALASLSVLHPLNVSFLPDNYIKFCNILSHALAKNKSVGAFSGASMQAQSSVAVLENIINGNASWIYNAKKIIEQEPATIALSVALATGLGALVAYKLHIPMISKNLKNELGKIPYPSLAVAGGKGSFLLYHLLEEKKSNKSRCFLNNKAFNSLCKFNDKQLNLLLLFKNKKYLLPHLNTLEKRNLLNYIKQLFPQKGNIYRSLKALLTPPNNQSTFMVTLYILLDYVPLILRCLISPISHSNTPLESLNNKIHKDLTRAYNAFSRGFYGIMNFINVFSKCFFELLINEALARIEGYLYKDQHTISKSSYTLLSTLDSNFTYAKSNLSQHLNNQKKQCAHPEPFVLLSNINELPLTKPQEIISHKSPDLSGRTSMPLN